VVSGRTKLSVLATGVAGMALPMGKLPGTPIPEGRFLVDAVVHAGRHDVAEDALVPWWHLAHRMLWVIGLFERLERRDRVRT
jgi:hypothetical protein